MQTLTQQQARLPNYWNIYYLEAKTEILRLLRTPGFMIPTLLFPVMFYTFFGIIFTMNAATMPTYLMVTYGVFGVIGPPLFSFGVGIAVERGQGWFDLKEVSAMPASAYVFARIVLTLTFSMMIILLLFSMGAFFGDVLLFRHQWLLIAVILLFGSLPFCAIGMALGLLLKSNSAPAVVNLIYLPMGFLSGLWLPINLFPEIMQVMANILPSYHLAQLALKVTDQDIGGNLWWHLSVLLVYSVVFIVLSLRAYNKKDKNS